MDIAAELRSRMAAKQITVAAVADLVGRTPVQVTRYRQGLTPIPIDVAQALYHADLLPLDVLIGKPLGKDAA